MSLTPHPAANKRTPFERERDRALVARLYLEQKTQHEIAEIVSAQYTFTISRSQIAADLITIQKEWQAQAFQAIDLAKGQQLARVDRLEREYWDAWEASRQDKEITSTAKSQRGTKGTASLKATVRTEQRVGDPRFLDGVQWCITERSKLLGVYAPVKSEHTGPDGGAIPVVTTVEIIRSYEPVQDDT